MQLDTSYKEWLEQLKVKIQSTQLKAAIAVNSQLLQLYWDLGKEIVNKQSHAEWGDAVLEKLSVDLRLSFPEITGFSKRNLYAIRQWYLFYSQKFEFVPQPVAQLQIANYQADIIVQQVVAQNDDTSFLASVISKISWSHHIILMDKENHFGKRLWYMHHCIEHGISRNILAMHIESGLFDRQVKTNKITNFKGTLPPAKSDFANYLLKDPYIFDFVEAKEYADERNIEEQLTNQVTKFLLELGKGFAFVARQMHFEVGGDDFYADLVFYHTRLKCCVIVELKAREFKPGDASKLNFYVNVANEMLKSEGDNETIGLLLCKGKNEVVAEYSLIGFDNALGISDYQISHDVPEKLKSELPQIEEIEKGLNEL